MSFIITNFNEFDAFEKFCKDNPDKDLVYMWCKNYYKVYYVGVTQVKGTKKTKYLNHHHTLPSLYLIFNRGDKLVVYLNYKESSIINFFRPKLNKIIFKRANSCSDESFVCVPTNKIPKFSRMAAYER